MQNLKEKLIAERKALVEQRANAPFHMKSSMSFYITLLDLKIKSLEEEALK